MVQLDFGSFLSPREILLATGNLRWISVLKLVTGSKSASTFKLICQHFHQILYRLQAESLPTILKEFHSPVIYSFLGNSPASEI